MMINELAGSKGRKQFGTGFRQMSGKLEAIRWNIYGQTGQNESVRNRAFSLNQSDAQSTVSLDKPLDVNSVYLGGLGGPFKNRGDRI